MCFRLDHLNVYSVWVGFRYAYADWNNVVSFSTPGEVIKLTDVKDFSLSLWLIFVICVCYYAAVFPFIGLGK